MGRLAASSLTALSLAALGCGSSESAEGTGDGGTSTAAGGDTQNGGAGQSNGQGGATNAGGEGGSNAAGDTGSGGAGGSGGESVEPPMADPCIALDTCPAGQWVNVTPPDLEYPEFGPGPVVKNPARPSDLYMGGGGDGLWKSTDYGNTWSKINDTIGYIPMGLVVAVAPTDPATIWTAGYKVLQKSVDDGATFETIDFDFPDSLYSIQVDPYDARHLISGLHEVDGIVESTDGGVTWAYVGTDGFPSGGKSWYVFFLDTGDSGGTRQSWFAIAQDGGSAVRTLDGGNSWSVPNGLLGLTHAHGNAQVFQSGESFWVAGIGGPDGDGMYRSTDGLQNFTKVTDGALSITWGSDKNVYGMWAWACAGCDLGSGFTVAPLPAGDTWSKPDVPAEMNIGANHIAVTSDGNHTIFVGTMWSAGVWRYVEP